MIITWRRSACECETGGTKWNTTFSNTLKISYLKNRAEQSETTYSSGNLAVKLHQITHYQ